MNKENSIKIDEKLLPKVNQIKSAGLPVHAVKLNGKQYIYRGINRKEFRDLQGEMAKLADAIRTEHKANEAKQNAELALLKEKGEETLVLHCIVDPVIQNILDIDQLPAGAITKLADLIMKVSGFDDAEPEESLQL